MPGKPFFFRGPPPGGARAARARRARWTGLANNHALDFEEDALEDTLAALEEGGGHREQPAPASEPEERAHSGPWPRRPARGWGS